MKRSFRHISLILIFIMITGALAACGGKSSNYGLNPNDPVTVTLWYVASDKRSSAYEEMINEFNETEGKVRGIIVESERFDSEQKLSEAAHKENVLLPDMVGVSEACDLLYDKSINFADINSLVATNTKENIFEEYITAGTYGENREWRLFPVVKDTYVLAVNPVLWSTFMNDAEHYTSELNLWESCSVVGEKYYDYMGQSMMIIESPADYIVLGSAQLGNPLISIEGTNTVFRVDGNDFRTIWDNYYGSIVKGAFITATGKGFTDLIEGKVPVMSIKTSDVSQLGDTTATEGDALAVGAYEVIPYPQFKAKNPVCPVDDTGIAIINNDETKAFASELFLEWLTSDDINMKLACLAGGLPVSKNLVSVEKLDTFLAENRLPISDLEEKTLRVAMQQYEQGISEDGSIYMPAMSEKYGALITYLGSCMTAEAEEDRYSVEDQTFIGISHSEAVDKFVSDDHFGQWMSDFKNGLPRN